MIASIALDIFLGIGIAVAFAIGYWHGFLRPLFGVIAIALGAAAAWLLSGSVSHVMIGIDSEPNRRAAAFFAIFLVVMIATNLMLAQLRRKVELGWVDHQLGWFFGLLRFCLATTFVLAPLQYSPMIKPVFAKSWAYPWVTFGGHVANLFLPTPAEMPASNVPSQIDVFQDLDFAVVIRKTSHKTACEVQVTGNAEIEKYCRLDWLLPTGPQWETSKREVGPDRWEHRATAELSDRSISDSGLFTTQWVEQNTFMHRKGTLTQSFHLPQLRARASKTEPTSPSAADDRVASFMAGWQKLYQDLEERAAAEALQSIAVPVRVQWELPDSIQSTSGADFKVHDRVVAWQFRLAPGDDPVVLSADTLGPNWGSWVSRGLFGLGIAGLTYWLWLRLRRREVLAADPIDFPSEVSNPEEACMLF